MAGNLGGLIVTLGLDATTYFTGLNKSEQQAKKFADRLEKDLQKGADLAKKSFLALVAAATAATVAIDHLIKQAGDFKDLEEKTGASAEALASFAVSAEVAGTDVASIAGAMNKLAKNLTEVDDESKAAGAALAALGIPIKEFKELDPAAQLKKLAEAFGTFADGAGKSAAAMALLGKSGAELLPFFKELASGSGVQQILTQEEIERADEYADAQKKIITQLKLYAEVVAIGVIPAFNDIIKAVGEAIKVLTGLDESIDKATRDTRLKELGTEIVSWAQSVAIGIGTVVESIGFLAKNVRLIVNDIQVLVTDAQIIGGGWGALWEVGKDPSISGGAANKAIDDLRSLFEKRRRLLAEEGPLEAAIWENNTTLTDALRAQFSKSASNIGSVSGRSAADRGAGSRGKPQVRFEGAQKADAAQKEAQKLIDISIKAQDRVIKAEQDSLKDREHYLQAYYDDNLISFREFYSERQRIFDAAQEKILAAQQEQINLAKKASDLPGLTKDERLAAEEKLAAAMLQRQETERAGQREAFDLSRDLTKATLDYAAAVQEVRAQMLELAGDTAAAAAIRFDTQNAGLKAKAERTGDTATVTSITALRQQQIAREDLNKATSEYLNLSQRLGNEQARTDQLAASGAITSLDAINQRSEQTRAYLGVLTSKADEAAAAIARMAPGPEQEAGIRRLEQLRLEIGALAEAANELENSFRKAFTETLADGLTDVVLKTKSVKDALKDMERQLLSFILRMANQNIAEAIFGKSGPGGAVPGILSGLFSGGGIGKGLDSFLFGIFGGAAEGGPVAANSPTFVGEKGTELFVPQAAGNIVPNNALGKGGQRNVYNINTTVKVDGQVTRATADQIALRVGAKVGRARQRNG